MEHDHFRILIADQNAEYRKNVQATLQEFFRHVSVAENGPQVLALCNKTPFDLVIVDDKLQGMLGIEVVRRLEQSYPKMRRILTSSLDTDPVIESALEYGIIDRFLQKPIEVKALVWEVEYLLSLRLEPPPLDEDAVLFDDTDDDEEDEIIPTQNYSLPFLCSKSKT